MSKKRNVDGENHLLTGGLIAGFLTFMGFLPGAAVGAAVTGVIVGKDVQKAKKEEDFKRDFAAHQARMKEVDRRWEEIDRLLNEFKYFHMATYQQQAELEELFNNATIVESFDEHKKNMKYSSIGSVIGKARKANDENKFVVQFSEDTKSKTYIVKMQKNTYFKASYESRYPYQFEIKCKKAGIPIKEYSWVELDELRKKMLYEFYAPYRFDYSKYH